MFVSMQLSKCPFVIYLHPWHLEHDLTSGPELRNNLTYE
jgi:hypothetical protein